MKSEKYKYFFSDFINSRDPLPDDINDPVKEMVRPLDCDKLIKEIEYAQKNRKFGQIVVYDSHNAGICSMDVHSGVVKTFQLIRNVDNLKVFKPFRVIFLVSHRNDICSFRKQKENKNA